MKICRLCLQDNEENLFSVIRNPDILRKIKECVTIEITDDQNLPTTVCSLCIEKVEDWSRFKENCVKSNTELINKREKSSNEDYFKSLDDGNFKYYKIKEVSSKPEDAYTCDICLKQFSSCLEHLDHQSVHDGQPVFKCDKCSQIYSSREELLQHNRSHKSPCPICGKTMLPSSLKLHLIKHTDKHKCPQCHVRLNSRANLEQHLTTVHTNIKDFICDSCGKAFSSKAALNSHIKSHSDQRMYKCKLCDYAGRTASALYTHKSTHSIDECICEVCSKIFQNRCRLNEHVKTVHASNKVKSYECTHCNKKFERKKSLVVHVRNHTGVRPYQCDVCHKGFTRSCILKEHMQIHGERTFSYCSNCGKKFATKKGLERHHCSVGTSSIS